MGEYVSTKTLVNYSELLYVVRLFCDTVLLRTIEFKTVILQVSSAGRLYTYVRIYMTSWVQHNM